MNSQFRLDNNNGSNCRHLQQLLKQCDGKAEERSWSLRRKLFDPENPVDDIVLDFRQLIVSDEAMPDSGRALDEWRC